MEWQEKSLHISRTDSFLLAISIHNWMNWQIQVQKPDGTEESVPQKNFHLLSRLSIFYLFIYALSVCVFVFACTCAYRCREELACVNTYGGQKSTLGVFLYCSLPYFWRHGLLFTEIWCKIYLPLCTLVTTVKRLFYKMVLCLTHCSRYLFETF